MRILSDIEDYQGGSSAIALGKFDGIHLGHRKLIKAITDQKDNGLSAVCLTFDGSIKAYLTGQEDPWICSKTQKREIFKSLGVDWLIELPVNKNTVSMEPEDFIEKIMVKGLKAAYVAAGPDMSFGYKGRGDFPLLQKWGEKYSFSCKRIEKLSSIISEEGKAQRKFISSTLVRESIVAGKMELVNELLGRPYSFRGMVDRGDGIGGPKLRTPTVNLPVEKGRVLPPNGVYYSLAVFMDPDGNIARYNGITNLGVRPTVSEIGEVRSETYLYNFEGSLYGREIEISLLKFVRPETKFSGLEELKAQIQEDKSRGERYFNELCTQA